MTNTEQTVYSVFDLTKAVDKAYGSNLTAFGQEAMAATKRPHKPTVGSNGQCAFCGTDCRLGLTR